MRVFLFASWLGSRVIPLHTFELPRPSGGRAQAVAVEEDSVAATVRNNMLTTEQREQIERRRQAALQRLAERQPPATLGRSTLSIVPPLVCHGHVDIWESDSSDFASGSEASGHVDSEESDSGVSEASSDSRSDFTPRSQKRHAKTSVPAASSTERAEVPPATATANARGGGVAVSVVEAFGELGVLQAKRGPAPPTVEAFGEYGVLQAEPGPSPPAASPPPTAPSPPPMPPLPPHAAMSLQQ